MGCVSTKVKGEGDYGNKEDVMQESSKECRNPLGSRRRSASEKNFGRSESTAMQEMPSTHTDEGETHFTKIELWVNTVEQYRHYFSTYPPIPQTPQSHPSDDVSQTSWHQARSSQSSDANCSDSRSFRTRGSGIDLVALSTARTTGRRPTDGGVDSKPSPDEGFQSQTDEEGEKTETTVRASDMQNESNADGSQATEEIRGTGVIVASKVEPSKEDAVEEVQRKEGAEEEQPKQSEEPEQPTPAPEPLKKENSTSSAADVGGNQQQQQQQQEQQKEEEQQQEPTSEQKQENGE
eukprot:TRINITY_DN4296_c1_g1_i1.p1 TRINITY_DN4296_c1_g1~~TRINITY_DN4296_c1_g1_i1.p1  ORF type:complete len:293 (+),score=80.19 TRINITY_DN4296_c1_g1_i1:99-977(+)